MGITLIEKSLDIHDYPTEIIPSDGDITIGDLHGNSLKLINFCLNHAIIRFKDEENAENLYRELSNIYEEFGTIVENANPTNHLECTLQKQALVEQMQSLNIQIRALQNNSARNEQDENLLKKLNRQFEEKSTALAALNEKLASPTHELQSLHTRFLEILESLEVIDKESLIRLIGDETADRGSSDLITMFIYKFLATNNKKITTIASNHGVEFLQFYYSIKYPAIYSFTNEIKDTQTYSLQGLQHSLQMHCITKEEFIELVDTYYIPTLKILDYTFTDDGGIRLFTHAPVKFDAIKYLANKLKIKYKDNTPAELADTIDAINAAFQTRLSEGKLAELFPPLNGLDNTKFDDSEIQQYPFWYMVWNRLELSDIVRPHIHIKNNYHIYYVHGHDASNTTKSHIISLDTGGAKDSLNDQQQYLSKQEKRKQKTLERSPREEHYEIIETFEDDKQEYINSLLEYKVLNSNEQQLRLHNKAQRHTLEQKPEVFISDDLVDESQISPPVAEHKPEVFNDDGIGDIPLSQDAINQLENFATSAAKKSDTFIKRMKIFVAVAAILGVILGITLVATGVLAPFGATILGAIGYGVLCGVGSAIVTACLGFSIWFGNLLLNVQKDSEFLQQIVTQSINQQSSEPNSEPVSGVRGQARFAKPDPLAAGFDVRGLASQAGFDVRGLASQAGFDVRGLASQSVPDPIESSSTTLTTNIEPKHDTQQLDVDAKEELPSATTPVRSTNPNTSPMVSEQSFFQADSKDNKRQHNPTGSSSSPRNIS